MKQKNTNVGQDAVTIISAGVMLEGKISSNGNVRIDGQVNGNINAKGNVTVGAQGEIDGEINAQIIMVGGKVSGSVNANEKVILEATSALKGDIITKILVIEEGAVFEGTSNMNNREQAGNGTFSSENTNEEKS